MNKLSIQINNLEALERLIGGDSEIEVDVRNSVIQKFAQRHLKAVVNTGILQSAISAAQAEITKEVQKQLGEKIATFKEYYQGGSAYDVKLHPEVIRQITIKVDSMAEKQIGAAVDAALAKWTSERSMEERISKRMDYNLGELVKHKVNAKFEEIRKQI